jgi:hypothetical protein
MLCGFAWNDDVLAALRAGDTYEREYVSRTGRRIIVQLSWSTYHGCPSVSYIDPDLAARVLL